jgi:hypothetical protein
MALRSAIRLLLVVVAVIVAFVAAKQNAKATKPGSGHPRDSKQSINADKNRPRPEQDPENWQLPARHQNIGAFRLGRPVKNMDTQASAANYVQLTKYSQSGCAGTAAEIVSIGTDVCYEVTYEAIYTDDDTYSYNFYGYYAYYENYFDDDFFDDDVFSGDDDFFGLDDDLFNLDDDLFSLDDDLFNLDDDFLGEEATAAGPKTRSNPRSQPRTDGARAKSQKGSKRRPQTRARSSAARDTKTAEYAQIRSVVYNVDSIIIGDVVIASIVLIVVHQNIVVVTFVANIRGQRHDGQRAPAAGAFRVGVQLQKRGC